MDALDIGLAAAYGGAWLVVPRPWRLGLQALVVVSLALAAPPGSYPWSVLLTLALAEVLLSLNVVRPGAARPAGLLASLNSFVGIKRAALQRHETGAGGGLPLSHVLVQMALYGSFVAWCMLTFSYFAWRDATAPRMLAFGLAFTAGVTLFQVPIHMMSAAFYTARAFRVVDLTLFPLHWAPVLCCTAATAALSLQWFAFGSFAFWWVFGALCVVPLGLSALAWRDTDGWWEVRRWAETTTWLLLAREPLDQGVQDPADVVVVVLSAVTLALGGVYLALFIMTEWWGKFLPLAAQET